MTFFDRLLTIVVTATLTSLAWIVFGGTVLEMVEDREAAAEAGGDLQVEGSPATIEQDVAPPASETPQSQGQTRETLRIPVQGVAASQLTDTFLDLRGDEGIDRHEAIDIAAPRGTPVLAAARGTVAKLHKSAAGGNAIYIRTPDRRQIHYYAHLDKYAPGLSEGQEVRAGQKLGEVGTTGNAPEDTPHLHFAILETTADAEWWEPANAVNPYPLLRERGR